MQNLKNEIKLYQVAASYGWLPRYLKKHPAMKKYSVFADVDLHINSERILISPNDYETCGVYIGKNALINILKTINGEIKLKHIEDIMDRYPTYTKEQIKWLYKDLSNNLSLGVWSTRKPRTVVVNWGYKDDWFGGIEITRKGLEYILKQIED